MGDMAVIGAGPAGLMAAEVMASAGHRVTVYEAKPSPARKLLMAGKSGLNLTRDEPAVAFAANYAAPWLTPIVAGFGPAEVMAWARGLGVELFTGSTGRVFPVEMKASPLLRAWLVRLDGLGVVLRPRWRWTGWQGGALGFDTPAGAQTVTPAATVLALGGASWPRLGSDAAWVPWLAAKGVEFAPFRPANMGFSVSWSGHMAPFFGEPLKGVALIAAGRRSRGECVLTARGIEGGGVYALSGAVRDGAALALDLVPDRSLAEVLGRLSRPRGGDTQANQLRKALHLGPEKLALLNEWGRPLPRRAEQLAPLLKALPVRHDGPRPIAEAISSAGGITAGSLTESLELRALPGTFAAGEMLDWEAPTGGYLLTACLATARHAARAAAALHA
jgi:uncharacterized flavoprotein (TIGR03862 family)